MTIPSPYRDMICSVCETRASYYDPWRPDVTWYCGGCVPTPVRDYHQLREAVQHALGQLPTVAALVPPGERRVYERVLDVLAAAEAATRRNTTERRAA
ncbi:MAG: hypothetical protein IRZ05_20690 [Micromonosporaceae bacterium]|nr:hypothetical protein [Micromonosporaceae bacterium]